jgi:hypothetical protein
MAQAGGPLYTVQHTRSEAAVDNALLSALGYVGDVLDKPGRAVRGLLGGRPEEAAAIVPFSDSMGLTDRANRVSGSDLLRNMGIDAGDGIGGTLAGIGVELATDPLTWGGAGLGAALGRRAGTAAVARGPRYETTADDLMRQVDGAFPNQWEREAAERHISYLNEAAPGVFREVSPTSRPLGVGAEGLALIDDTTGGVTRIGLEQAGKPGRPIADTMLQPTRTADYRGNGNIVGRAERLPFAEAVGSGTYWNSAARPGGQDRLTQLFDDAMKEGIDFMDIGAKNAGRVGGRDVIIDPGAALLDNFRGAYNPAVAHRDPGALMGRLLDMLGSDDAIRAGLTPAYTGRLASFGGAGGASLGGLGRLNRSEL